MLTEVPVAFLLLRTHPAGHTNHEIFYHKLRFPDEYNHSQEASLATLPNGHQTPCNLRPAICLPFAYKGHYYKFLEDITKFTSNNLLLK